MSRETDSSSSGPQGRGGPYPPGQGPYGPGAAGNSADPGGAAGAGPDPNAGATGRPQKRKTETTLTTRIRINIPGSRPIPPVVMRTPVNEGESGEAPSPGGMPQQFPSSPSGQGPPAPVPGGAPVPGLPGARASSEDASGGGDFTQETSEWFAPRKGRAGSPGTMGGQGGAAGGQGVPPQGDSPYGVGNPYGVADPYGSDPYDTGSHQAPTPGPPPGPTSGPASGEMRLPQRPIDGGGHGMPQPPAGAIYGMGTAPAPYAPGGVGDAVYPQGPGGPPGPQGPAGGQGLETYGLSGGAEGHPGPAGAGAGNAAGAPTPGGGLPAAPRLDSESDDADAKSRSEVRTFDGDDNETSSGRSVLMLTGVAIAGVIGIAYGAGLLLDHADVPNGTTVLGVDIGGTSRHEAVNKLDAAFGDRTTQPFTVVADGKKAKLKPSVAGLTLNTEATVRAAAGRDYNPVNVIGSLFGADRKAEPALRVDKEKMKSALADVSRDTGDGKSPTDGAVKFVKGKAVAVPGKPHKGIDPAQAGKRLEKAYRVRAETGKNTAVELPVTLQQPTIGKEELDRAIADFGKPAMSGLVTVKAGDASIQFSPEKSLPKFLSMKPVNGTLVDAYDLPVLKELYGTTFDGVKIERGNGTKTEVTPQDVAGVLRLALKETSPAKRVQEIPNVG